MAAAILSTGWFCLPPQWQNLGSGVQFGMSDYNVLLIADEVAPEIVDALMALVRRHARNWAKSLTKMPS